MDNQINIKIKKSIFQRLRKHLLHSDGENESFCFLYCYESTSENTKTYYPHVIVPIDKQDFSKKESIYLKLKRNVMKNAYADFIMDENFSCLISCHSHPFDNSDKPVFSKTDDNNDREQATWFYNDLVKLQDKYKKSGTQIEYLHLVMSQNGLNIRKYNIKTRKFEYVNKVIVFSDSASFFFPSQKNERQSQNAFIFSRTDKAFGDGFTKTISNLSIAIIGVGGIGSVICEGVARLGIKELLLIDPDKVEISNLNRLQGASINDVGKYKVDVMKANLEKYFNNLIKIIVFKEDVQSEKIVMALKSVDIIIGCVDNHATRYFLNRFSIQYLIPYLDAATRIIPNEKSTSVIGRVGVVLPSITSCMDCSHITYYNSKEVYFSSATDIIKQQLENAGYIKENANIISPAVYPQNLTVSGLLLMELMNIVVAYKPLYDNVMLDYSKLDEEKQLASSSFNARKEDKLDSCLICDEYLGKGDSVNILNSSKVDLSGLSTIIEKVSKMELENYDCMISGNNIKKNER